MKLVVQALLRLTAQVVAKAQGKRRPRAQIRMLSCERNDGHRRAEIDPPGFVRIHRCILVNAILVKDLRRDNTGTYMLRTTDGNEHPVGRTYKDNLKAMAQSRMGIELL